MAEHPLAPLEKWVMVRLSTDNTLKALLAANVIPDETGGAVYHIEGPEGAQYPLVVFSVASDIPVLAMGTTRVMMSGLIRVCVVDECESTYSLKTAVDRVDVLLTNPTSSLTADSTTIMGCWMEQTLDYPEDRNGKKYRWVGGYYRIFTRDT